MWAHYGSFTLCDFGLSEAEVDNSEWNVIKSLVVNPSLVLDNGVGRSRQKPIWSFIICPLFLKVIDLSYIKKTA